MEKYCYFYVLLSRKDRHFYVAFTKDLPARLQAHTKGEVFSTRRRGPLELVYWEGCLDQADSTQREKYLKSAWGKRYIKNRLRNYLTG
jgi:putative endonuclease